MKENHKRFRPSFKDNSVFKFLIPSLLGMIICMFCLLGTTWAWFSASVSTNEISIKASDYYSGMSILVNGQEFPLGDEGYTLESSESSYEIIVKNNGMATTSYLKIIIDDSKEMYTDQVSKESPYTFTIYPEVDGKKYVFTAEWGTYSGDDTIIANVIGTPPVQNEVQDEPIVNEETMIETPTADENNTQDLEVPNESTEQNNQEGTPTDSSSIDDSKDSSSTPEKEQDKAEDVVESQLETPTEF